MALVRDTTKGRWRASTPSAAGVHALIIGISDYPHLDGGSIQARAADTGGMGQLEVCALSAARIFHWLDSRGTVAGAPVATCHLLLAPRPAEQPEIDALTQGWYDDATFGSIRAATQAWGDDARRSGRSTEATVAFFFFSGHGLEHIAEPSLLARDILDPSTTRGRRNALSFNALWQAIRTYGVDSALFFADACRNAPELAKRLSIVGESVLEPEIDPGKAPSAIVWLQATRPGAFAYQLPGNPGTMFGQALLGALEGLPPDYTPYDTTANPWRLVVSKLESHVKQKVRDLLSKHSATKLQLVEPGGYPYNGDALVAERPPEPGAQPGATPAHPLGPLPDGLDSLLGRGTIVIATRDLIHLRSRSILSRFETISRAEIGRAPRTGAPPITGDLGDEGPMHVVLRHESVTIPWTQTLKVLDIDYGTPVPEGTISILEAQSEESDDRLTAWIDLRIEPGIGRAVWIQAGGDERQSLFVVTVPRDPTLPIPVRLDVTFRKPHQEQGEWRWALESMTARLAPPGTHFGFGHDIWEPLWQVQRLEALADLAQASLAAHELGILASSRACPIAAAIGAALFLRAGALERLLPWPKSLDDGFSGLSDGSILRSETLLRHDDADRHKEKRIDSGDLQRNDWLRRLAERPARIEARGHFEKLKDQGPPSLGSVLAMAARQAVHWRALLGAEAIPARERSVLEAACEVVERAGAYATQEGVFSTFVSHEARTLSPEHLFGPWRDNPYAFRNAERALAQRQVTAFSAHEDVRGALGLHDFQGDSLGLQRLRLRYLDQVLSILAGTVGKREAMEIWLAGMAQYNESYSYKNFGAHDRDAHLQEIRRAHRYLAAAAADVKDLEVKSQIESWLDIIRRNMESRVEHLLKQQNDRT